MSSQCAALFRFRITSERLLCSAIAPLPTKALPLREPCLFCAALFRFRITSERLLCFAITPLPTKALPLGRRGCRPLGFGLIGFEVFVGLGDFTAAVVGVYVCHIFHFCFSVVVYVGSAADYAVGSRS